MIDKDIYPIIKNEKNLMASLKSSSNFNFNTDILASPRPSVKFCDKISVAIIIDNNHHIAPQDDVTIQNKGTAQPVQSIFQHMQWKKTKKRSTATGTISMVNHSTFTTINTYNGLEMIHSPTIENTNQHGYWILQLLATTEQTQNKMWHTGGVYQHRHY